MHIVRHSTDHYQIHVVNYHTFDKDSYVWVRCYSNYLLQVFYYG